MWPLCSLQSWVDWAPLHGFAKSATSLERQRSVMLTYDVSRDFFRSRWVFPSINLVCLLLGWPFYNSKSSKPNRSTSPFGRRSRKLLVGLLVTLSELPILPLQWLDFMLAEALVKTPHRLSASSMSLLNKAQGSSFNTIALALSLFPFFALTAFFSAPHSSKELFIEQLKKLKKLIKLIEL